MKSEYRVVVIGGGVVGASVIYHLAKLGWSDIAIVERSVLTAGSSWHAAGGIHALNADPNIAALQAYTIDLLSEIEQESGQDIGMHMTGGISVASAPERWEWLQATYRIYQTMGIEDVRLMERPRSRMVSIISLDGVLGGLWADREGYIDPSAVVHSYAKAARDGRPGDRAQPGPPSTPVDGRGTWSPSSEPSWPNTLSTRPASGPSKSDGWPGWSCPCLRWRTITSSPNRSRNWRRGTPRYR